MGIDNFGEFIKDIASRTGKGVPLHQEKLSKFSGTRIAIDTNLWMYGQMYGANKRNVETTDVVLFGVNRSETIKKWIISCVEFVIELLELNITPVFVLDGEHPNEKTETRKKRREKTQKGFDKIKELEETIKSCDPLNVPDDLVEKLKKAYIGTITVSKEEEDYLCGLLKVLQVPVIQAKAEAEALCAALCIEGIVHAVISKDSDSYVYGCPALITKIESKYLSSDINGVLKFDRVITVRYLDEILTFLDIPFNTFVDLCIMGGTDFNDNIRSYALYKSYVELVKCGRIERLPENLQKSISVLNHERVREIFKQRHYKEHMDNPENGFDLPKELNQEVAVIFDKIDRQDLYFKYKVGVMNCKEPINRKKSNPSQRKITIKK